MSRRQQDNTPAKNQNSEFDHKLNFNLVLHTSPMTFLGAGSSGPLSRCPDVKYNHPFQYPTRVVFTRYGSFPITDHFCKLRIKNQIKITICNVYIPSKEKLVINIQGYSVAAAELLSE